MNYQEFKDLSEAYQQIYASIEEELDIYNTVIEFLCLEGYASTLDEANWMVANELTEKDIHDILEATKWIQKAIKKPGALSKSLGVPEEKNIPAKKLAAAAKKGGKLGKRARLAQTLRKLARRKKKG